MLIYVKISFTHKDICVYYIYFSIRYLFITLKVYIFKLLKDYLVEYVGLLHFKSSVTLRFRIPASFRLLIFIF